MMQPFPFSAIVGQEEMKRALVLTAIDPGIGGVLVFGDRGTGKSTAVRALAALLPSIRAVAGCPGSATSSRFAATLTSGVEATTAATLSWNQRYAPPAAEPITTSNATPAQASAVRTRAQRDRGGGSGWR